MALKQMTVFVMIALAAAGCRRGPAADAEEEEVTLSVTRWTDKTELFAEYPPLTAGHTSRFAIHLTRLGTFKALLDGRVEVQLHGGPAPEIFSVDAPSRPGIFGVDVKPTRAGTRQMVITVRASGGLVDEHRVGDVEVYATPEAATAAAPPEGEGGGISFLKEQQWTLDFATAIVGMQAVRESIRIPGRIEPRAGGAADVAAPIDGRLVAVLDGAPGTSVARGQELARIAPPASSPGDLPQLERARADARSALSLATRDRERAERLVSSGAAPQRRLDEARTVEEQARARVSAADASLAQYNNARSGTGGTQGLFIVRAPISGVIAQRSAASGANVTAGTPLFRVVDAMQVHVVGQIPEPQSARARLATAAEIEVPGRPDRLSAGRLVSLGRVLDPQTRTLPITFAYENRGFQLPVGQPVFLYLLLNTTAPAAAVPASAIVDDAGRPIVFVQTEGESFERRAVTLGARAGDIVQLRDGVTPGERVVSRGAHLVRLASLSTTVPAHGHVH